MDLACRKRCSHLREVSQNEVSGDPHRMYEANKEQQNGVHFDFDFLVSLTVVTGHTFPGFNCNFQIQIEGTLCQGEDE